MIWPQIVIFFSQKIFEMFFVIFDLVIFADAIIGGYQPRDNM